MGALFRDGMLHSIDESTEAAVLAGLERRHILTDGEAAEVTAVLSGSCLRRQVGGPEVMRDQLRHLALLSEQPNICLHAAPFSCRTAAGLPYPFVRFRVPSIGTKAPPLEFVFVEQYHNGDYLDGPNEVAEYSELWHGLLGAALDPTESRELLHRAAVEHRPASAMTEPLSH